MQDSGARLPLEICQYDSAGLWRGTQVRCQPQNVAEDASSRNLRARARPPHDQRLLLVPRRGEGDDVVGATELCERVVPLVPPQLDLSLFVHRVHNPNIPQDLQVNNSWVTLVFRFSWESRQNGTKNAGQKRNARCTFVWVATWESVMWEVHTILTSPAASASPRCLAHSSSKDGSFCVNSSADEHDFHDKKQKQIKKSELQQVQIGGYSEMLRGGYSYRKCLWHKALYRNIRKFKLQTWFPSQDNDLLQIIKKKGPNMVSTL